MNITVSGVSITLTEEQLKELNEKLGEQKKTTPEEWLKEFISQPFEVIHKEGYITYYLDGQWIFQQDFQRGVMWCYYYKVWEIFKKVHGLEYWEIQDLHRNVVNKSFNCDGLTPMFYPFCTEV